MRDPVSPPGSEAASLLLFPGPRFREALCGPYVVPDSASPSGWRRADPVVDGALPLLWYGRPHRDGIARALSVLALREGVTDGGFASSTPRCGADLRGGVTRMGHFAVALDLSYGCGITYCDAPVSGSIHVPGLAKLRDQGMFPWNVHRPPEDWIAQVCGVICEARGLGRLLSVQGEIPVSPTPDAAQKTAALALLKRFVTARTRSCYDITFEEIQVRDEAAAFVGGWFCPDCGAWREAEDAPRTCCEGG